MEQVKGGICLERLIQARKVVFIGKSQVSPSIPGYARFDPSAGQPVPRRESASTQLLFLP